MSIIFRADMGFYDVSSLGSLAIFRCPADLSSACPEFFSLMITMHNSTALKVNGMTEELFIFLVF